MVRHCICQISTPKRNNWGILFFVSFRPVVFVSPTRDAGRPIPGSARLQRSPPIPGSARHVPHDCGAACLAVYARLPPTLPSNAVSFSSLRGCSPPPHSPWRRDVIPDPYHARSVAGLRSIDDIAVACGAPPGRLPIDDARVDAIPAAFDRSASQPTSHRRRVE